METTIKDTDAAPRLHGRWLTDETGRLTLTWELDGDDRAHATAQRDVKLAA